MNDDANENNAARSYREKNNKTTKSRSFEYKANIIGITLADNKKLDTEVVVPLNNLSDFWRSLDLHLVNCLIELGFRWSKNV